MNMPTIARWAAVGGLVAFLIGTVRSARSGSTEPSPPAVAVEAAEAVAGELVETVDVVGTLSPKSSARLKSEYSGIVSAVYVTDWVPVRKGQPLARLDTREADTIVQAAHAAVQQAEVGHTRAVREWERAEKLKAAGLMTAQALEDARTARDAAVAALEAARAQSAAANTRLTKMVIRAPFDGVVAARDVDVGDRVENMGGDAAMFEIVDDRVLEVTMTVPSSELHRLRPGQTLEFTTDAAPASTFAGRVTHISPSVDPQSRSARVVGDVDNAERRLKGGLFVQGHIRVAARTALQIPRAALRDWDIESGEAEVLVLRGDIAEARHVRTGAIAGDVVEITGGLTTGERVATRGAFAVKPGDHVYVAPPPGN